jgi:hypothetical protein
MCAGQVYRRPKTVSLKGCGASEELTAVFGRLDYDRASHHEPSQEMGQAPRDIKTL